MNLFKEVADIKTADQLNLPTPEVEYHNIVAQPEHQKEMVKALSSVHRWYTAAALTPQRTICSRLPAMAASWVWTRESINKMLPDEPGTKVNQCPL